VLKITNDDRLGRASQGRSRGRGRQLVNKALTKCFKCHKLGNFQYLWPKLEKAHFSTLKEAKELLLVAYEESPRTV